MTTIGKSIEGRELVVLTVMNPATGPEAGKCAMWIDGNVHGNEVQGSEASLYAIWYLLDHYGEVAEATKLVDERVFYVLPSQNPDGRAYWFEHANTSSSSRSGLRPTDNDGDGLFDEDGPDDLNGDGVIGYMRKYLPGEGDYRLDPDDRNVLVRVPPGKKGDWILLGEEGIDNDGDGLINEDGPGGYDMNRNWPAGWMPNFIQFGAAWPPASPGKDDRGLHPRASQHRGGAVLPQQRRDDPARAGLRGLRRVSGADDARLRPRSARPARNAPLLPVHGDLARPHTVYGGFVTWTHAGAGILSFTNEMWNGGHFQKQDGAPTGDERPLLQRCWATAPPFTPFKHPFYGDIEIGGDKKMTGRVPPSFMIEEMLHRNAAFCWFHAGSMPKVAITKSEATKIAPGVWALTVTLANEGLIPTRTALASQKREGRPDLLNVTGEGLTVVSAAYPSDRFRPERDEPIDTKAPAKLRLEQGVPGRGEVKVRFIVRGEGTAKVVFDAEKGGHAEASVELSDRAGDSGY
jgi:hypothetical protein